MINKISDKDKKDWENFLSSEEKLPDKDLKFKKKNIIVFIQLIYTGIHLKKQTNLLKIL